MYNLNFKILKTKFKNPKTKNLELQPFFRIPEKPRLLNYNLEKQRILNCYLFLENKNPKKHYKKVLGSCEPSTE